MNPLPHRDSPGFGHAGANKPQHSKPTTV